MSTWLLLPLRLWWFAVSAAAAAAGTAYPFSDCFDHFIPENSSVTCYCKANNSAATTTPSSSSSSPSFFWLDHSGRGSSWELRLTEVTRAMNDSRYVCAMQDGAISRNVSYQLKVAYGPSNADTAILAPSPFITDGSRDLNLSCQVTNTYPDPWISWTFVRCREGLTQPCLIRPQVWQDGQRVACTATSTAHPGLLTASAEMTLNLNYPPEQPPQIRTQTSNTILKTGDTLTCTVAGGKPPVRRVIFNCSNPALRGVSSDVTDGVTSSLSSYVIVDSSEAGPDRMVCWCRADWQPNPSLYAVSSTASFLLEYKATITNFTVNTSSELVVMEADQSAVEFHCDVMGRASAEVTLHKQRSNSSLGKTVEVLGEDSGRRKVHRYVLQAARCEDMGVFTCTADSGYLQPASKSVRLTVNCGPRPYSPALGSDAVIQLRGLQAAELRLVAYPVPQHLRLTLLAAADQRHNLSQAALLPALLPALLCQGEDLLQHLVTCRLGRGDLPADHEGLYNVSLANAFGAFTFLLHVSPVENDPALSAATAVLISSLVAATVVIVIIVFVVFVLRKRRGRDVECTRVSNRRSLAAAFVMEADDDPSNSRVPFVEVRPISSDIQFKSTNPSEGPVPFSHILPSLSSDGGPRSESLGAQSEGLPVLTSLLHRASDFATSSSSPLPRAQVSPFFSAGPSQQEVEGGEKKAEDDGVEEDALFEEKMADSEAESPQCPPIPAPGGGCPAGPAGCGGDRGSLAPAGEAADIVWMDSAPESLESTPRLLPGAEEGHSTGLKPPGPDSSPLQSLVSSGSRSRTFITKIYLPKQSSDAESHGREESGESLSVGPLGDEYAVVNKAGKEGKAPTRPLLKEVFAAHKDGDCVEAMPGHAATVNDYDTPSKTRPDSEPATYPYHSAAYEDVLVPGEAGSKPAVEKKGRERPQPREKPQRWSGETAKSGAKVKEAEEPAPGVDTAARSSATNTDPAPSCPDKGTGGDTTAEAGGGGQQDADLQRLLAAQPRHQAHTLTEGGQTQNSEQTLQTRQLHRFFKKRQEDLPGEREQPEGSRQVSTQGSASLTRHRRKKADSEDALSLPESQDESSFTLRSGTTPSTAEAPKPKKRTRKLTKRRRKSDLDDERDEAHIPDPAACTGRASVASGEPDSHHL